MFRAFDRLQCDGAPVVFLMIGSIHEAHTVIITPQNIQNIYRSRNHLPFFSLLPLVDDIRRIT